MRNLLTGVICGALLTGQAARAEVPHVAADILPVHALVARVMEGAGAPALIVPPGASPHGHAMRPSEAGALQRADLVVWMGDGLTPWLTGPVETLSGQARVITLLTLDETRLLDMRTGADFSAHDHDDHDDHGHDDHGHDDHSEDDHGEDNHGHDADAPDPHAWLDPQNAAQWLPVIAGELAALDPENAALYRANALAGQAELAQLAEQIAARLAPVQDHPFVVFHDAYHYFETRFGLSAAGSVSPGDASGPSAARVAALRDLVQDHGVTCALSEPQFQSGIFSAVQDEGLRLGVIDPLGSALEPGPDLYPQMLRDMAAAIAGCLVP